MVSEMEPLTWVGRVVSKILGMLGKSPNYTLTEGAVLQEVRVLASPNAVVTLSRADATADQVEILDALVRNAFLVLQAMDGVVVEYQLGSSGDRVLRISRPAEFTPPSSRIIETMVHDRARYMSFPQSVRPELIAGADDSRESVTGLPQGRTRVGGRPSAQRHAQLSAIVVHDEEW